MAKRPSAKERKERLKDRTKKNAKNKNSYGKSGKRIIDVSAFPDAKFYQPEEGYNEFDIIPYIIETDNHPHADEGMEKGYEDYILDVWIHAGIGPMKDTFVCMKKTYGKPCPICDERERLANDGADDNVISRLNAQHKAIYNVLPLDRDEDTIQIFIASYAYFEKELLDEAEAAGKTGDETLVFSDIEDGFTVGFRASEEKFNNFKFFKYKAFKFLDRDPYAEDILEESYPLDSLLVLPTYEEVRDSFFGVDPDDEEDDEPEEEKPIRTRKKRSSKKVDPELDEIEEDEIEDEPEEVEEEKPTRSRKKRTATKKVVPEPEEDEPEEDEVEEDEDTDNQCPYGHRFGVDVDEQKECKKCKKWDACVEAVE